MRLDAVDLIGDRARIVRVQHHEVDHRRLGRDHHIALPVGELAVGKLQQHVEAAQRRLNFGEAADETAGLQRALDAAAEFEKPPAGKLGHVFLRQPRER